MILIGSINYDIKVGMSVCKYGEVVMDRRFPALNMHQVDRSAD